MRNLALDNAYTDYVLLMDVDFMPSHGLSNYLSELIPTMKGLKDQVSQSYFYHCHQPHCMAFWKLFIFHEYFGNKKNFRWIADLSSIPH